MSYEERDKAFRIMEALSSVDEALLARSEKTVTARKVIPFWRYGKTLAACFVFVLLGACALGVYTMVTWRGGSSDRTTMEAPRNAIAYDSKDLLEEATDAGGTDSAQVDEGFQMSGGVGVTESCKEDLREKLLTWEEAGKVEMIGNYLPTEVPAGYQLESISGMAEEASYHEMTILWVKGMDDICLHITDYYAVAKNPEGTGLKPADISKPEMYDVHLYEIPYCDTVPREYAQVFDNPVFLAGDLTLDLVEARMKTVEDGGDTDTPRGRFAVLYDSGVLVEFNGKAEPEEVWDMFASICP